MSNDVPRGFLDVGQERASETPMDPTSRVFEPKLFIHRALADVSHRAFEGRIIEEVHAEEARTEEALKQLIRDHLGTFVDAKGAMDDIFEVDRSLFSGEALETIAESFQHAVQNCRELVQPIMSAYDESQRLRTCKDALEKNFSILSVPGVLYRCCGVHVATRRGFPVEPDGRSQRIMPRMTNNDHSGCEDESGGSENDISRQVVSILHHEPRGALEALTGMGGMACEKVYLLEPDEEILWWYGTPLVRPRGEEARRFRLLTQTNLEAAVLHLRRALLYLEETYNLFTGTPLGIDNEIAAESLTHAGHANGNDGSRPSSVPSTLGTPQASDVDDDDDNDAQRKHFILGHAMALLRAALYVAEQLAAALTQVDAADTVVIEDTLSMMMDVSIATVKLRHFSYVLKQGLGDRHGSILAGLQDQLAGRRDEVELHRSGTSRPACTDSLELLRRSFGKEGWTHQGVGDRLSSGCVDCPVDTFREGCCGTPGQAGLRRGLYHPVQYFVDITSQHHMRLTVHSAEILLCEALEWKAKQTRSFGGTWRQEHSNEELVCTNKADTSEFTAHQQSVNELCKNLVYTAPSAVFVSANNGAPMLARHYNDDSVLRRAASPHWQSSDCLDSAFAGCLSHSLHGDGVHGNTDDTLYAKALLGALCDTSHDFATLTTCCIGGVDVTCILESSCEQLIQHTDGIIQQLNDLAEADEVIMAQGALFNTFASRLAGACALNLEHVISPYWGGVATAIHSGTFDFEPPPNSTLFQMLHGPGMEFDYEINGSNLSTAEGTACVGLQRHTEKCGVDDLPRLRFIPVIPDCSITESGGVQDTTNLRKDCTVDAVGQINLRVLSVRAVRGMVRTATDVITSLFGAYVNRGVTETFLAAMARHTVSELAACDEAGESVELHAAVLVEVLIGQWGRIMEQVSEVVRRIKVSIGEGCSATTVTGEQPAADVMELLGDLEQLRSNSFRCYINGLGMLSKAYITMLPMLQHSTTAPTLRTRLSREFVSSCLPNKLLNLLAVVIDHAVEPLQRSDEVHSSADLFAMTPEDSIRSSAPVETSTQPQMTTHGRQKLRRSQAGLSPGFQDAMLHRAAEGEVFSSSSDAVAQHIATVNRALVRAHLSEHEELVQSLVLRIVLAFVDMLHMKSHSVGGDAVAGNEEAREAAIVESIADALFVPSTVVPLLTEHLLQPCLFEMMAAYGSRSQKVSITDKISHFQEHYMSRVGEHCQLAVDAMIGMFLVLPQQRMRRMVRQAGFMVPLFDWQRISAHVAAAVRPYVTDCIVVIAKAREALNLLHQPSLSACVTQRLVAHLAFSFVTAVTSDTNAFELSSEGSIEFITQGLVLIEAEALVVLGVVNAVYSSVMRDKTNGPLPELQTARSCLQSMCHELTRRGTAACQRLAISCGPSGNVNGAFSGVSVVPLTVQQRDARRERLVNAALHDAEYMIEAIQTHLEETALSGAFPVGDGDVIKDIADRLAKRKHGYQVPLPVPLAATSVRKQAPHTGDVKETTTNHGDGKRATSALNDDNVAQREQAAIDLERSGVASALFSTKSVKISGERKIVQPGRHLSGTAVGKPPITSAVSGAISPEVVEAPLALEVDEPRGVSDQHNAPLFRRSRLGGDARLHATTGARRREPRARRFQRRTTLD